MSQKEKGTNSSIYLACLNMSKGFKFINQELINSQRQHIDLKNNSLCCCFLYLQLSNYCSFEGVLYCRPHYDQLFKRTGSLDKSFEGIIFLLDSNTFHLSALPFIMILNLFFFLLYILSGTPKILKPEKHVEEVLSS